MWKRCGRKEPLRGASVLYFQPLWNDPPCDQDIRRAKQKQKINKSFARAGERTIISDSCKTFVRHAKLVRIKIMLSRSHGLFNIGIFRGMKLVEPTVACPMSV